MLVFKTLSNDKYIVSPTRRRLIRTILSRYGTLHRDMAGDIKISWGITSKYRRTTINVAALLKFLQTNLKAVLDLMIKKKIRSFEQVTG